MNNEEGKTKLSTSMQNTNVKQDDEETLPQHMKEEEEKLPPKP